MDFLPRDVLPFIDRRHQDRVFRILGDKAGRDQMRAERNESIARQRLEHVAGR